MDEPDEHSQVAAKLRILGDQMAKLQAETRLLSDAIERHKW
jgi:hypothetical protein